MAETPNGSRPERFSPGPASRQQAALSHQKRLWPLRCEVPPQPASRRQGSLWGELGPCRAILGKFMTTFNERTEPPWKLRLQAFPAAGMGLLPRLGTKIPHAMLHGQKNKGMDNSFYNKHTLIFKKETMF